MQRMLKVKLKPCDGPCQKDKQIWKNLDGKQYCQSCWNKIKPKTPAKPRTAIARTSDKRSREDRLYYAARIIYLKIHPVCHVNLHPYCTITATDVHHRRGRGKYYLDQTFWLPVCRGCHTFVELNPKEAIDNGWSLLRLAE